MSELFSKKVIYIFIKHSLFIQIIKEITIEIKEIFST